MTQRKFERGIVAAVLFMVVAFFSVEMQAQVDVAAMPFVKSQFFNGSTPCNGCKLYSYSAGTTTPLVTYTDSTGTVANQNPVVMDSNGYPQTSGVWLGPNSYKLILKTSADVQIWSEDGVKTQLVSPQITGKVTITDSNNSENALQVNSDGTGGTAARLNATGTNSIGLSVSGASSAISASNNNASGIVGLFSAAASSTQIGLAVRNSVPTNVFTVLGSGNVTNTGTLTTTGAITTATSLAIAGGTALTTTNQTGTGNLVLQSSPTLVTPNIGAATAASLAATTITVGTGGTAVTKILSTSFVFDFGSIAAGTCADSTAQTLTGAVDGDPISVGALAAALSPIQINITAYVSAADQVKIRACNPTVGAIDPASTTFRVRDIRF